MNTKVVYANVYANGHVALFLDKKSADCSKAVGLVKQVPLQVTLDKSTQISQEGTLSTVESVNAAYRYLNGHRTGVEIDYASLKMWNKMPI